ncbi:FtsX-like permease family protein [Lacticaseibacillus yichunensis]|uniref:FtsX-like permease family protein n=1 Tax=Lacticaseibacillus yichunensis TaxID=2486015 RepID=A0ABW4CRG4_9LACO|nr:FtsX-like permease family protein [Lacticaseibacillus yichunensis]
MLRKLALGGIRSRLRDYTVLFSGLVIASAVFYMFLALATNKTFLTSNSPLSMTTFIFMFGEVLLAIITLVYIVYANSFLMSMRQRDYAMFMMLGAKSSKIAQLIFVETVTVGVLATAVGTLLGIGLTTAAGHVLLGMLHSSAPGFSPLWWPAVLWTFVFFVVLFILAALFNARSLIKTKILTLLHAAQTPNRLRTKPVLLLIQALLGIGLLAIGYWAMAAVNKLGLSGIGLALVTIVLGSYFMFNATLVFLVGLLKKNKRFASRQLHTFTLSQLSFRIRDYTKILAVVSILFALALGAITVGLGFQRAIPQIAKAQDAYDLVQVAPTAKEKADANKLSGLKAKVVYTQKADGTNIYFKASELNAHPLEFPVFRSLGQSSIEKVTATNFKTKVAENSSNMTEFMRPVDSGKSFTVVSDARFAALAGQPYQVITYQVADFSANYDRIEALVKTQDKRLGFKPDSMTNGQKFGTYALITSMYGGLAFMGFFLGIAFLAMLASTLMFKILSGANYDKQRYLMLQKIGVRPALLRKSIAEEIGALFLFPGLLGVIHVLFGLQLFKALLADPYDGLWLPFTIFLVLYGLYYALTTWLYQSIVITKDLGGRR